MTTKPKQVRKNPPPTVIKQQEKKEKPISSTYQNRPQTASGLDQEAEDQFELELCWCIQQLQAGLSEMKLQDKQVFNLTKSLNVLKSNNSSLIKKRQVMRNTFGDYRIKMADDEKKYGKAATVVKFIPSDSKKFEQKSSFLKKAQFLKKKSTTNEQPTTADEQSNKNVIINPDVSNEPFKFNFSSTEP